MNEYFTSQKLFHIKLDGDIYINSVYLPFLVTGLTGTAAVIGCLAIFFSVLKLRGTSEKIKLYYPDLKSIRETCALCSPSATRNTSSRASHWQVGCTDIQPGLQELMRFVKNYNRVHVWDYDRKKVFTEL